MEGDLLVNKPIGKKLGSQKKKEKKNKQTNKFCLRTHKPILCLTFKLWSVLTPCYLAACSVEKTNIMQNPGLHLYASSSHRIIESLNISSWKGPLRIMKSKSLLLSGLRENPMTKSVVQMFLELWPAWCCHHFPGKFFHCLTMLSVKNLSQMSNVSFSWCCFIPFPWVVTLVTKEMGDQDLPLCCPSWCETQI